MTKHACLAPAALVVAVAALLGCSPRDEIAGDRADTRTDAGPSINAEPLPLGLPLPEKRESCRIADGLWLTRITRGITLRLAQPLPCESIATSSAFGGGNSNTLAATGPWVVHVLEMAPETFAGEMLPALAQGRVAGKATVAEMADTHAAIAAVNAGFFVVGSTGTELSADGITGEPAGVTMMNGELLSEAIRGRTTLVWNTQMPSSIRFPSVHTPLAVRSDDALFEVDGINRAPGLIRNCGGINDNPTDQPLHDVTCTDADELIWHTDAFGRDTVSGDGLEAVIDDAGMITEIRAQGGPIPAGGAILTGTGSETARIRSLLPGSRIVLDAQVLADGEPVSGGDLAMLNAGPRLLRNGLENLTDVEGGFQHPEDPTFGTVWVSSPQPRTFVGRMSNEHILFVVVDGRQPDWSVGIALEDGVSLMAHLGAVDAMNLDGGGSSTMLVNGSVINQPSDANGLRPVADAVVFVAR